MLSCAPSPFQEGFNQHWFSRKLFKVNFKDRPEFFPDWLSWEIGGCGFKILILPTISFNHSLSSTPPPHPVSSQTLVLSPSFLSILIFSPPPYLTLCSFRGLFPQEGAASKQFSPKGGFFCVCSNITKWVSLANEQLGGRGGKNFRSSLALASSGPNKNEPESGKAPYEQWELLWLQPVLQPK